MHCKCEMYCNAIESAIHFAQLALEVLQMTTLSNEITAMAQAEAALKDLDEEERFRVLQWLAARFRMDLRSTAKNNARSAETEEQPVSNGDYTDLAEFYDDAAPGTDAHRALVAAYWFQIRQGSADVEAQTINKELKHLGHGVGNITRAFDSLKSHKPALIVQTRKDGKSKQARKRYKVTGEGKKAVERLIAGESE